MLKCVFILCQYSDNVRVLPPISNIKWRSELDVVDLTVTYKIQDDADNMNECFFKVTVVKISEWSIFHYNYTSITIKRDN